MELSELTNYFSRLIVLNNDKADLAVELAEALVVYHNHSVSGISKSSSVAAKMWSGRHPTEVRAELDSVNSQINQIFAEMKSKGYAMD